MLDHLIAGLDLYLLLETLKLRQLSDALDEVFRSLRRVQCFDLDNFISALLDPHVDGRVPEVAQPGDLIIDRETVARQAIDVTVLF